MQRSDIVNLSENNGFIFLDGAMGTMLQKMGLESHVLVSIPAKQKLLKVLV